MTSLEPIDNRIVCWVSLASFLVGCAQEASAPPAPTHSAESATQILERLDRRASVPLLPMMAHHQKQNMREHLEAVQAIVAGLATLNFTAIEQAATRLGASEGTGHMCAHMGAAAPGFTEQAMAFHHQAGGIVSAARDQDTARVLTELASTLNACTTCHATWKQELVDETTWNRLTATASKSSSGTP